ncbi:uncharacterized protein [Coffea arabica]|uniref:Endonuclease/exonuclease/phosphatase domain-containing protein n=1 Tax=Coffea arabica TaxID=13443 RepID=A0A6P6WLS5_COFAR|nr:uncharacterized protein LOC113734046 [Coffea arabica]
MPFQQGLINQPFFFGTNNYPAEMLKLLNQKLKRLCLRLRWPIRRRSKHKVVVKKFGKSNSRGHHDHKDALNVTSSSAVIHPSSELNGSKSEKPIRIATFNAALFSMAPAVPKTQKSSSFDFDNEDTSISQGIMSTPGMDYAFRAKSMNGRPPKSILKQSPLHSSSMREPDSLTKQQKFARSKLRVSINLPDNEISLRRSGHLSFRRDEKEEEYLGNSSISRVLKGKAPLRSTMSMPSSPIANGQNHRNTRAIVEVLRELNADILALQDVKAEEERGMQPLSDLAAALGMTYVFAESWAPEYGNAILSRYPIKRWKAQKIFDDADFRNVLKATIDVPHIGELNFYCTHLDHLDENWRMKQINAIIQSTDAPHILAGGLNSLDESDYSPERWTDIVKYYEEMGKPTPKVEVMKYLKGKQYTDAKHFAGECESVVMIAKGQSVQGTCKYGTRVDYILSSPSCPYKFVPGSYSVFSSKGTSDHHIVKVDVIKVADSSTSQQFVHGKKRQPRQRVVRITHSSSAKGVWKA